MIVGSSGQAKGTVVQKLAVLFVCTGNICRSPSADGVMRHKVRQAGLADKVTIDSAATLDYHAGEAPDARAVAHARKRGYDLSSLRARRVSDADFEHFDLIMAMDRSHYSILERRCPEHLRHKLHLFMTFAPGDAHEVPDPYYGGAEGFEYVLDLIEAGCDALLQRIASGQLAVSP